MMMYIEKGGISSKNELLVITLWGSVSHLKNCTPEKNFKQVIKGVLGLVEKIAEVLSKKTDFRM